MSDQSGHRHTIEERYEAFVKGAPIGIATSTVGGRIVDANDTYLEMIGYSREELERGEILWRNITPPEWVLLDEEVIREGQTTGRTRAFEKEYIAKDGRRVPILIGFALMGVDREDAIVYTIDLSAQKKAEAEVKRLNTELERRVAERTAELEAANKELEAFCYAVSHDLRAPLRSIDGFAYALSQDYEAKLDAEGKDFISRIRYSAKRMDELISALLTLSRITTSDLVRQSVDLSELADTVAFELTQANLMRNIQFEIQPHMTVQGDKRMIRSLLDNLMNNAVKFTAPRLNARISVVQDPDTGWFSVTDNGVGFDMAQASKLFKPFERLHSPREFAGNGIGLATAYRVVRKHGGKITAEAEVDAGTKISFWLP
jgi:PAS domain S-box-containing protein